MYAAGASHPFKSLSIAFLKKLTRAPSTHTHCINTEVLQELLHRYRSIRKQAMGFELFDAVVNLGLVIHPIEISDMRVAKNLLLKYPRLSTRDAVHLGVVLRRGISKIVSFDSDFDDFAEIERVEPR